MDIFKYTTKEREFNFIFSLKKDLIVKIYSLAINKIEYSSFESILTQIMNPDQALPEMFTAF